MTAGPTVARPTAAEPTAGWRPMPIGSADPRKIRDAVAEPLWGGDRVIVAVRADEVSIVDAAGLRVAGHQPLREALAAAVRGADHLILDGHLVAAPLGDGTGAFASVGMDSIATPGQLGRQMLLGRSVGRDRQRETAVAVAARGAPPQPDGPAAFVAVDLLWLDGTSLLSVPLVERKRLLESVLDESDLVRRTVAVRPPIEAWYGQWRALGFREIVVKSANGRYTPGVASADWATLVMRVR